MKQIYRVTDANKSDFFNTDDWLQNQIIMNGTTQNIKWPFKYKDISQTTSFDGEKTFTNKEDMGELMYYSTIGALLWEKNDKSEYVVTNGNNPKNNPEGALGYDWDPTSTSVSTPTKEGYTLIAVNVGLGKWAYIKWKGLTTNLKWATSQSDPLYTTNHAVCVHGGGYESTQHILTEAENNSNISLTGTIWEAIKSVKETTGFDLFIPSKYELLDMQTNCCDDNHKETVSSNVTCSYNKNLGKLLQLATGSYWSASQHTYNYYYAYSVYFANGGVNYYNKTSGYRSVAFLHF